MTMKSLFPLFAASVLLAGCVAPEDAKPTDPASSAPAQTAAPAQAPAATPGVPPMMGSSDPMAPLSKTPELDKKVADAVKSDDKKAIAVAYTERGDFRQHDEAAGARMKYRAALSDFRKALKADPKNADALTFKKNIEEIYKSMGRPVPTEDVP